MAATVCPAQRGHRTFFTYSLLLLFAACLAAASWILGAHRDPLAAAPFVFGVFLVNRNIRWSMFWASTPEEQKVLARGMEHEPLLSVLREWIKRGRGTDPASP